MYATSSAVYVGTRLKRRLCKKVSGPVKTAKDLDKFVAELPACLQSANWTDSQAPTLNGYNFLVAGGGFPADLPATIGRAATGSPADVYEEFTKRRSAHFLNEASRLLDMMMADNGRGETKPLICASSMKEAALARRNALMKKVYVHESKHKFIQGVRADNDVEMYVITGDVAGTRFDDFGGIVFELFYRADLSVFS